MSKPDFPIRLHPRTETAFAVTIDDTPVTAYPGETVAAVLMTAGQRMFAQASEYNLPRTLYCVMGVCHQCLVTIDGVRDLRACMITVQPEMEIKTE